MKKQALETMPTHWQNHIENLSINSRSVAIGIFDRYGNVLFSNDPMQVFLDKEGNSPHYRNQFINPGFPTFFNSEHDGLQFEGYLTIGNYSDISYVLYAKAYRKNNELLLFAEADVFSLFEENNKMSELNQQVNNLQRQLIKEKKTLERTLAKLKETQQMLVHSEKMNALGKLVAGVAHEINNPISFVYSNLHMLNRYVSEVFDAIRQIEKHIDEDGSPDLKKAVMEVREKNDLGFLEDDVEEMLNESKAGVERVRAIVDDLRRFSRLDESAIKQVDLIENIRSTLSIAKAQIADKNIDFSFEAPGSLWLECYPGQLNQAVLNVLINAIQAVDRQGRVSCRVVDSGSHAVVEIEDNGPGISGDIKNRIFDPFFTTKPVGSGTGLGLSIVYKIIYDLHKGTIDVISLPDEGSTFRISIPKSIR